MIFMNLSAPRVFWLGNTYCRRRDLGSYQIYVGFKDVFVTTQRKSIVLMMFNSSFVEFNSKLLG